MKLENILNWKMMKIQHMKTWVLMEAVLRGKFIASSVLRKAKFSLNIPCKQSIKEQEIKGY